jgi:hypothetical protein
MPGPRTFRALACALAAAVCLAPAGSAHADSTQESIFQDDLLLVGSGAAVRESTLDELQSLGVDTIRVFVPWAQVAPDATSTVRPTFDAADPRAYPAANWAPFDDLLRSAASRSLSVIVTPTTPLPAWASRCGGSVAARQSCRPDPAEFGQFVRALGTRWSGSGSLPLVSRWGLMNEPNVGRWLTPQWVRRGGRLVAVSPSLYRQLAAAAISALQATGHGGDQILLGETAPIGHTSGPLVRRPVATAEFWRDLLCIAASGRRLTGRAAREQGCTTATRLNVTAVAHHPYVRGGSRSPLTPPRRDEIAISSISRLKTILAQGARRGMIPRRLPLFYTEFGFQSRPPDRILGVPLSLQAAYLDESEWIAYRDPAVRGLAQYLLRDDPQLAGFQSGLEFLDGRAKPALAAYRFPLWVVRRGVSAIVFGRVRPGHGANGIVHIQLRLPGKGRLFTDFLTARPNSAGFFVVKHWSRRGTWRARFDPTGGGDSLTSRIAHESAR